MLMMTLLARNSGMPYDCPLKKMPNPKKMTLMLMMRTSER